MAPPRKGTCSTSFHLLGSSDFVIATDRQTYRHTDVSIPMHITSSADCGLLRRAAGQISCARPYEAAAMAIRYRARNRRSLPASVKIDRLRRCDHRGDAALVVGCGLERRSRVGRGFGSVALDPEAQPVLEATGNAIVDPRRVCVRRQSLGVKARTVGGCGIAHRSRLSEYRRGAEQRCTAYGHRNETKWVQAETPACVIVAFCADVVTAALHASDTVRGSLLKWLAGVHRNDANAPTTRQVCVSTC